MENILDKILIESLEDAVNRSEDIWKGSVFHKLLPLSSDERGRWGEDYFHRLMTEHTPYKVEWDGDSNTEPEDGIYDMKITHINSLRTELKTAMKGTKNNSWQHDVIKEEEFFDRLVFLDLRPEEIIQITVIKNTEMVYGTRHPIFEKKSSPCKGGWKFDMSNATLRRGINAGLTYIHDLKNPNNTELSTFLSRHFA